MAHSVDIPGVAISESAAQASQAESSPRVSNFRLMAVPAGGIDKSNKDTPGELSAQLACSPNAACVGDDVPSSN